MESCVTDGVMGMVQYLPCYGSCFGIYIRCHSFSLAQSALLALPVMPELWSPSQRFALGGFAEEGRKMSAYARLGPLLMLSVDGMVTGGRSRMMID